MKNITVEQTRAKKLRHCFVRAFVPISKRVYEDEFITSIGGMKVKYLWTDPTPTSIPKKIWSIVRVRMHRAGQLELGI